MSPRVRADVARIEPGDPASLPEAERAALERAVPKRVDEFVAGRQLARRLLEDLGIEEVPAIGRSRHGAPIWPSEVVGSISHAAGWVAVAVARSRDCPGLGIDLESSEALESSLWPTILTVAETAELQRLPAGERGVRAKLIFCAKEAAYKAQYPRSGELFGFDAMAVRVDPAGEFTARFLIAPPPFEAGDEVVGRSVLVGEMLLCVATLSGDSDGGARIEPSR